MIPERRLDVAVLGTGPLALIEGLRLAEAGRKVTFLDRGDQIGGSWTSPDILGFGGVEVGVHLIENRARVNDWMEQTIGFKNLITGNGLDFGVIKGKRLSITTTRIVLHSLVALNALRRGHWGSARRISLSAARAILQYRRDVLYPKGGMRQLLGSLVNALEMQGAEIHLNTPVERVSSMADGVTLHGDGWQAQAEKLVMFSRAHAPIEGMADWEAGIRAGDCHSLILHLGGAHPAFDGYVEIIGDALLKRVRNVGHFARPMPQGDESLICAQLRAPMNNESGAEVLARLAALNLVPEHTHIIARHEDVVPLATLTPRAQRAINRRFNPRIEVLESTDFADCLETRLRQLKSE